MGFHKAQSHDIVALKMCPVLVPEITERLDGLKKLGKMLASGRRAKFKLTLLSANNGLDITIAELPKLSEETRKAVIGLLWRRILRG